MSERISYLSSIRHKINLEGMYLFHKCNEGDHIRHWQQIYQQRKIQNNRTTFHKLYSINIVTAHFNLLYNQIVYLKS
ncbi:MAG: hypothetical protein IJ759_05095 [Bacteroidales bacterium]|nr:hypothetical protein [Bacteroidales bacterium]